MNIRTTLTTSSLIAVGLVFGSAHATNVTYSFTGGGGDTSYQSITQFTRDSLTGDIVNQTGQVYSPDISASMSFTVDASGYSDVYPMTIDHTLAHNTASWLYSSSYFDGPLFSQSAGISQDAENRLEAYYYTNLGLGTFTISQRVDWHSDFVQDSWGRTIAWTRNVRVNNVNLSGEMTLGLVGGQELPVYLGSVNGNLSQSFYTERDHFYYDGSGSIVRWTMEVTQRDSSAPILWAFVSGVPEPESYAMMLSGLGLIGYRARRKLQKVV